jgi:hypothetical protein
VRGSAGWRESTRPSRRALCRIPRRRNATRVASWAYALSAISMSGRLRGRPTPPTADCRRPARRGQDRQRPTPAVRRQMDLRAQSAAGATQRLTSPRGGVGTPSSAPPRAGAPARPSSPNDCPLNRQAVVVDLRGGQSPIPRAVGRPPAQPLMAGLPRPVPLGQIPPCAPSTGSR